MNVETTNTPNGASIDKYSNDQDIDKMVLTIIDMAERNPEKDFTGEVPGDNTIVEGMTIGKDPTINEGIVIGYTTQIRDFGFASTVLKPVEQAFKDKNVKPNLTGKEMMKEFKQSFTARGIIMGSEYYRLKAERLEKEKKAAKEAEESEIDGTDKNHDGIDDRNQ